jgi:6-phosphogluconolactonase/glucosamine-6-phosphate isomerase/deaminase
MLNYNNYLYKNTKMPKSITLTAQAIYNVTALAIKAAGKHKAKVAIAKKQADLGSGRVYA